ncbi:hypothetical protein [Roseimicrobium sp. ORNL1]|uniref:hypothetical protein n=1 Tax=Roseimicrobium sp. ORNL1 TaxID=2711231 RepID=UPI0013E11A94|nr:hypothetical protein [Roseimicrobium sp. ORNL1]QIF05695.1 hypothetical protein G5S37_30745 [Roseimicrobium sp. ORNL1]
MEEEKAHAQAGSQTHEKRRLGLVIGLGVLCLAAWACYMLMSRKPAILHLPGGTRIIFLEAVESKTRGSLHENGSGLPVYTHGYEIPVGMVDKLRGWLPERLDRLLPGERATPGMASGFNSPVRSALWFAIDGPFEESQWRFFWVDDQGYETEANSRFIEYHGAWLGMEGNVPRSQKLLHLKVRSKKGEEQSFSGKGVLGEVVAEVKFRNPLRSNTPAPAMTAQTLPAKVGIGEHTFTLAGAMRPRVVSVPTLGLHLDLHLDGPGSKDGRFDMRDWTIEDGTGNVMIPVSGTFSGKGQEWDCAPWSDTTVWRIRFVPVYEDPKYYSADEIFVLDPMPMPPPAGFKGWTSVGWHCEKTIGGHTIRLGDVKSRGPNEVVFPITISPPVNGHSLQMLHAADESGSQTSQTSYGREKHAASLHLEELGSTASKLMGRCRRPAVGNTLTLTFAFKEVTPVEFTFRPEFKP